MGYTHYWDRQKRYSRQDFNRVVTDLQKLNFRLFSSDRGGAYGGKRVILAGGDGEKRGYQELVKANGSQSKIYKPVAGTVNFNGYKNDGHETFRFDRIIQAHDSQDSSSRHPVKKTTKFYFDFCKTAQKPYDLMVCACLIVMKYHLRRDIAIRTDGDNDDWEHATDFVRDVLNYDIDRVSFECSGAGGDMRLQMEKNGGWII